MAFVTRKVTKKTPCVDRYNGIAHTKKTTALLKTDITAPFSLHPPLSLLTHSAQHLPKAPRRERIPSPVPATQTPTPSLLPSFSSARLPTRRLRPPECASTQTTTPVSIPPASLPNSCPRCATPTSPTTSPADTTPPPSSKPSAPSPCTRSTTRAAATTALATGSSRSTRGAKSAWRNSGRRGLRPAARRRR